MLFSRTSLRTLTNGWSSATWPRPTTASAGASSGSMPPAMRTRMATSTPTATDPWRTATGTTSSAPSTGTGPTTASYANSWQAMSWPGMSPAEGLPPAMPDPLTAPPFLRTAPDGTGESDGNPDEVRPDRFTVLEGNLQNVMNCLLGIPIQCARCPGHKFEPIRHEEYYRLQA